MRFLVSLIVAFCFSVISASAQNGPIGGQTRQLIEKVSVNDVTALMETGGFSSQFLGEDAQGVKTVLSTNEQGGAVYFALRACDGTGANAGCNIVQPYGLFASDGITYAQLNNFNINRSQISLSGLLDDGSGIVAAKIYVVGGITVENFLTSLGLFLRDIEILTSSITPGTLAQVNYPGTSDTDLQSDGIAFQGELFRATTDNPSEWRLNPVGRKAPKFLTEKIKALLPE